MDSKSSQKPKVACPCCKSPGDAQFSGEWQPAKKTAVLPYFSAHPCSACGVTVHVGCIVQRVSRALENYVKTRGGQSTGFKAKCPNPACEAIIPSAPDGDDSLRFEFYPFLADVVSRLAPSKDSDAPTRNLRSNCEYLLDKMNPTALHPVWKDALDKAAAESSAAAKSKSDLDAHLAKPTHDSDGNPLPQLPSKPTPAAKKGVTFAPKNTDAELEQRFNKLTGVNVPIPDLDDSWQSSDSDEDDEAPRAGNSLQAANVCTFYGTKRGCRRGANCRFVHPGNVTNVRMVERATLRAAVSATALTTNHVLSTADAAILQEFVPGIKTRVDKNRPPTMHGHVKLRVLSNVNEGRLVEAWARSNVNRAFIVNPHFKRQRWPFINVNYGFTTDIAGSTARAAFDSEPDANVIDQVTDERVRSCECDQTRDFPCPCLKSIIAESRFHTDGRKVAVLLNFVGGEITAEQVAEAVNLGANVYSFVYNIKEVQGRWYDELTYQLYKVDVPANGLIAAKYRFNVKIGGDEDFQYGMLPFERGMPQPLDQTDAKRLSTVVPQLRDRWGTNKQAQKQHSLTSSVVAGTNKTPTTVLQHHVVSALPHAPMVPLIAAARGVAGVTAMVGLDNIHFSQFGANLVGIDADGTQLVCVNRGLIRDVYGYMSNGETDLTNVAAIVAHVTSQARNRIYGDPDDPVGGVPNATVITALVTTFIPEIQQNTAAVLKATSTAASLIHNARVGRNGEPSTFALGQRIRRWFITSDLGLMDYITYVMLIILFASVINFLLMPPRDCRTTVHVNGTRTTDCQSVTGLAAIWRWLPTPGQTLQSTASAGFRHNNTLYGVAVGTAGNAYRLIKLVKDNFYNVSVQVLGAIARSLTSPLRSYLTAVNMSLYGQPLEPSIANFSGRATAAVVNATIDVKVRLFSIFEDIWSGFEQFAADVVEASQESIGWTGGARRTLSTVSTIAKTALMGAAVVLATVSVPPVECCLEPARVDVHCKVLEPSVLRRPRNAFRDATQCVGIVTPVVQLCYASTLHNERIALTHRVAREKYPYDPRHWERVLRWCDANWCDIFGQPIKARCYSFRYWANRFPNALNATLTAARKDCLKYKKRYNRCKPFIKREMSISCFCQCAKVKAPRVVCSCTAQRNALCGYLSFSVAEQLKHDWNLIQASRRTGGPLPMVCLAIGKNIPELSHDMFVTLYGKPLFEADFSKFETTRNRFTVELECRLAKHYGLDHMLLNGQRYSEHLREVGTLRGTSRNGMRIVAPDVLTSGAANTSWGNSTAAVVEILYGFSQDGKLTVKEIFLAGVRIYDAGDDSLSCCGSLKFDFESLKKLGLIMEVETPRTLWEATFCSQRCYPCIQNIDGKPVESMRLAPKLSRLITRTGTFVDLPNNLNATSIYAGALRGHLAVSGFIPIVSHMCLHALDLCDGYTATTLTRRYINKHKSIMFVQNNLLDSKGRHSKPQYTPATEAMITSRYGPRILRDQHNATVSQVSSLPAIISSRFVEYALRADNLLNGAVMLAGSIMSAVTAQNGQTFNLTDGNVFISICGYMWEFPNPLGSWDPTGTWFAFCVTVLFFPILEEVIGGEGGNNVWRRAPVAILDGVSNYIHYNHVPSALLVAITHLHMNGPLWRRLLLHIGANAFGHFTPQLIIRYGMPIGGICLCTMKIIVTFLYSEPTRERMRRKIVRGREQGFLQMLRTTRNWRALRKRQRLFVRNVIIGFWVAALTVNTIAFLYPPPVQLRGGNTTESSSPSVLTEVTTTSSQSSIVMAAVCPNKDSKHATTTTPTVKDARPWHSAKVNGAEVKLRHVVDPDRVAAARARKSSLQRVPEVALRIAPQHQRLDHVPQSRVAHPHGLGRDDPAYKRQYQLSATAVAAGLAVENKYLSESHTVNAPAARGGRAVPSKGNKRRIHMREMVGLIYGSGDRRNTPFLINIGNSELFPWASKSVGSTYASVTMHHLRAEAVPITSTVVGGTVILSQNPDPDDEPYKTDVEAANSKGAQSGAPWDNVSCDCLKPSNRALKTKFITDVSLSNNSDVSSGLGGLTGVFKALGTFFDGMLNAITDAVAVLAEDEAGNEYLVGVDAGTPIAVSELWVEHDSDVEDPVFKDIITDGVSMATSFNDDEDISTGGRGTFAYSDSFKPGPDVDPDSKSWEVVDGVVNPLGVQNWTTLFQTVTLIDRKYAPPPIAERKDPNDPKVVIQTYSHRQIEQLLTEFKAEQYVIAMPPSAKNKQSRSAVTAEALKTIFAKSKIKDPLSTYDWRVYNDFRLSRQGTYAAFFRAAGSFFRDPSEKTNEPPHSVYQPLGLTPGYNNQVWPLGSSTDLWKVPADTVVEHNIRLFGGGGSEYEDELGMAGLAGFVRTGQLDFGCSGAFLFCAGTEATSPELGPFITVKINSNLETSPPEDFLEHCGRAAFIMIKPDASVPIVGDVEQVPPSVHAPNNTRFCALRSAVRAAEAARITQMIQSASIAQAKKSNDIRHPTIGGLVDGKTGAIVPQTVQRQVKGSNLTMALLAKRNAAALSSAAKPSSASAQLKDPSQNAAYF